MLTVKIISAKHGPSSRLKTQMMRDLSKAYLQTTFYHQEVPVCVADNHEMFLIVFLNCDLSVTKYFKCPHCDREFNAHYRANKENHFWVCE
jgi:hypothetical protein